MTDMTVADVRAMWTKAMASGEYNRIIRAWHTDGNNYCAIGILSHLAIKAGVIDHVELGMAMPEAVYEWAGLEVMGSAGQIIRINDDVCEGNDFGPVIRFIENMSLPE